MQLIKMRAGTGARTNNLSWYIIFIEAKEKLQDNFSLKIKQQTVPLRSWSQGHFQGFLSFLCFLL